MAYYPNNTVPIPTTGPHSNRSQELPARAQRTNQVQYVEERLRNGLSPLAVAGVAALLTQLDTMQTLPGVSVSLVTEVAGYRRTLTCQNSAWDGHDLTHQFLYERSTTMLGPSQGTRFEQEASLCMVPANVATMPPPQMVALPPPAPKPIPMTPTYSGSPAFGTSYRAPHMVLQTTTSAPVSDREPSGSRLPPIPNPELTGRSTGEQAVIVALQAVANYPNSSDFVRAVEQRIPGLATSLQAAVKPSGCDPPAPLVETASMGVEIAAGPSNSASAVTGAREEIGRKRLTEETVSVTPAGSVTTIPAQVTRSLRPRDADMSEQAWEQRAREQLPMTTNNYMAPLQHNITEQFPARYVLREGETWEANARYARYARNLRSLKPLLKAALQRARYCMAVDSTCRSDLPIDNLMPDVLVLTMPLSRFAEIAEMVGAIYDPNLRGSQKEPPPQRVIFANLLDHMACAGLLRDLDAIMSDVRRPGDIAALVNEVVGAMERAAGILRGRLGALALFVSPPGFMYWPRSLQQFVYILLEVCKARRVEFAICAPNLRVDREDLRSDTLSYPAFFAAASRVLVAIERSGNAQLTIDDAILYDHGMRMGRMAFDLDGNRIARESNVTEREAVRRYNWLVRKDKEIPVRAELAELTKQIGAWPAARTVERTIPQIHFASGIEPVKLSVGLRCIVAIEATNLKAEVDAATTTYAYWYQTRFATRTLAEVARELNCPLEAFCTSLGLGWNLEVITSEFSLTPTQTDKLLETIGEATVGEILALALAMGPTKFVAGPLALLVDIVIACDLTVFYSYLVLAQGQLRSLTRWGHLMTSKDQQEYSAQLERMRASIQHWLYSTLVFASGLFVGVDQSQPLHNSDQQVPRETAGFPLPQQIADLTLAEVEDFVAVMAPVLAPSFGAVGVCRYPTKPLATAVQVHMVSFSTYMRGRPSLAYPRVIHAVLSGEVPHGYTTLKTERELEENLMGLLRARTRKASPLPREHGPVNWYSAPLSLEGVPFRFPWSEEFVRKAIRASTSRPLVLF